MRALISRNKPWSAGILAAGISLLLACGGGGGGPQQTFGVVALNNVGTIGVLDGSTQSLSQVALTGELGTYNGGLFDVAISPDGKTTLVSNFGDARVNFIDTTDPSAPVFSGYVTTSYMSNAVPPVETKVFAEDIAFTPNGRFALVTDGGFTPKVFVIDVASRAIVDIFDDTDTTAVPPVQHSHQAVAVGADGRTVLTVDYFGAKINVLTINSAGKLSFVESIDVSNPVWDPVANKSIKTFQPVNVEFSPDGCTAIVAGPPASWKDNAGTIPADMVFPVLQITGPGSVKLSQMLVAQSELKGAQSLVFNRTGTKAYVMCTAPLPSPYPTTPGYPGPENVIRVLNIIDPGQVRDSGISIPVEIYGRSQLFGVDTLAVDNLGRYLYVSNPTMSGAKNHIQVVDLETNSVAKTITFDPTTITQGTPPVPTATISYPAGIAFWHK